MASINLTYKGLTGVYGTITGFDDTTTIDDLITAIATDEGLDSNYYTVSKIGDPTDTISITYGDSTTSVADLGIVDGDAILCTTNQSGTKEIRQKQKLDIAQLKRKATFRDTGIYTDPEDAPYYRSNNDYDLTSLPDTYNGNFPGADDNPNTGGLLPKRPWVAVGAIAAPGSISESIDSATFVDLQVWYDGADTSTYKPSATDEGQITQWTDKSAFAHNANPVGGSAKPTYENTVLQPTVGGYGYIEMDGTEAFSINPVAWTQSIAGFTAFIVAKPTSEVSGDTLMTTNTGDFKISHNGSTWTVGMNGVTAVPTSAANTLDTWAIFTLRYDAANNLVFRLAKTAYTLGAHTPPATSSASNSALYLGYDGSSTAFTGFIGEVIMFNKALSATEYANVENYLSNKWGL